MPIEIWWDLLERELKIALEDLEGRSTRSVGRESRLGVSAFHPAIPKGSATLDIANHPFGSGFLLRFFPRPEARRRPSRRLVRVGMTLLP
jgi:hypothetical protein